MLCHQTPSSKLLTFLLTSSTQSKTMVPEPTKQSQTIDRQVREMVNAITSRVTDPQKPGASRHHQHQQEAEEDENGVRIITLAGTNTGATMRTELDDKPNNLQNGMMPNGESDALGTYVNSNFQAVNNSIMFGSHYNTNDPGVHLDISDVLEHHGHPHPHKSDKHSKKGKNKEKKDKDGFKSDQQTQHSD